jgi:uncharacterized protein (TIGR02246 family)
MCHHVNRIAGVFLFCTWAVCAQTQADDAALRKLPQAFCEAWAHHDGHALASIVSDDVDFVTVGGTWLHGKADFGKYHTRLLSGRFKESSATLIETAVRFLQPDLGIVHWNWTIQGDKNPDNTLRQPRFGMMVMLAQKRNGRWLVVVAQNTQRPAGNVERPLELEGITTPLPVPGIKPQ